MLDTPHHHTDEQLDALADKLLANSIEEGNCFIWAGALDRNGYGAVRWNGERHLVHRLGWLCHIRRPILKNVLHSCDNPRCWLIDHLFEGTQQDNMDDMRKKGRAIDVRGEQSGRAILNEDKVRAIRLYVAENKLTYKEIGEMYGVSHEAIGAIKRGRSWIHVS